MLAVSSIIPMPQLDPAGYVDFYLQNPVLLALHPERMAAAAERVAAGKYSPKGLAALALALHEKRKYADHLAVEPADHEARAQLLELARHPQIDPREQANLRQKIFLARPSEYAWLRAPIEAAIIARAEAAERRLLQAA